MYESCCESRELKICLAISSVRSFTEKFEKFVEKYFSRLILGRNGDKSGAMVCSSGGSFKSEFNLRALWIADRLRLTVFRFN